MDIWALQIPIPLALAVVATIGYIFGRRTRNDSDELVMQSRRELRRAQNVASELEKISLDVRKSLARHHAAVTKFKEKVANLSQEQRDTSWTELCDQAEQVLSPTLRLATQLANAYDEIRQQSSNLMAFTEVRTDPLTGVNNRRGLDDSLCSQLALKSRYDSNFSLVIYDVDHFKKINDDMGHLHGDRVLRDLAKLLDESVRETDIVARYGGEEFVVIMPQTDLAGASIFAERLRERIDLELPLSVSGGVSAALDGDTQDSLLARADAAMYSAKSAGRNRVFRHDGQDTEPVAEELTHAG